MNWKNEPNLLTQNLSDTEPIVENCQNGFVPQADCITKEITVPVVTTMTKYLFKHYRLKLYSYLNRSLRNGYLESIVGFKIANRVINKSVCTFKDVNYWRIDRLNFWADIETQLKLDELLPSKETIPREWHGHMLVWFEVGKEKPLECSVESLSTKETLSQQGLPMLSPYLVPYFTNHHLDVEAEEIWNEFIPEALTEPIKRNAASLATAMGLTIEYYPLYKHKSVDSILFLKESTILVKRDVIEIREDENGEMVEVPVEPQEVTIEANTIVINTNIIKRDYSDYHIFHECIHYYEHYLFFCLQECYHNDITRMKTEKINIGKDEKITNPVYWMEKQANRGAFGLMMPITDTADRIWKKCDQTKFYSHHGEQYERVGNNLAQELRLPAFRVKSRMIQLGHLYAKGALNYVDRRKIMPFSFDLDSVRDERYTFVIDPKTAKGLYDHNEAFKQLVDSGKYIYADGHYVRNDSRFVKRTIDGLFLTPWAVAHVDRCCLRFERIYEQQSLGRYIFGRMHFDSDFVKQTEFYLHDWINEQEMDELEAQEQYIADFPKNFEDAFNQIMRCNGLSRDTIAEAFKMDPRTLDRWLADPDKKISPDFVMLLTLILKLPDWLSNLMFKRAHIMLDDDDRRHKAFRYIQRVLWMDGVEKANAYLASRRLSPLEI